MTTTPNLGITEVAATDTGKATKINTALSAFDSAFCAAKTETLTTTTFTLPLADFQGFSAFVFVGSVASTGCVITLPSSHGRAILIQNQALGMGSVDLVLTFKNGSGTIVAVISDSNWHLLYSDGSNNVYKVS